jgi:hypothetical protein
MSDSLLLTYVIYFERSYSALSDLRHSLSDARQSLRRWLLIKHSKESRTVFKTQPEITTGSFVNERRSSAFGGLRPSDRLHIEN